MGSAYLVADLKRVSKVLTVLSKHGFDYWLSRNDKYAYLNPVRAMFSKPESPINPYVSFRQALEELGGTYIKLGQLLSIRPDLVPVQLCVELQKLQDNVPPFPYSQVKQQIEKELGKPLDTLYKSFDKQPIAAASIGQVHGAVLHNEEKVVVKVQRPAIAESIRADIDIMRYIAGMAERRNRTFFKFSPQRIIDEFERYTRNELDYMKEGRNADALARNLSKSKRIVIPKIYWDYTNHSILTMQHIEGKKLSQLTSTHDHAIVHNLLTDCNTLLLREIFEDGLFHADLHPGNILLTKDHKIALLDFGIVGRFDEELRAASLKLFVAMLQRDASKSVDALLEIGIPSETTNVRAFRREISEELSAWYGHSLGEYHITHLMHRFLDIAYTHNVKMPEELVLFAKALVTMEGTALEFDPEFDFVLASKPYMKELLKKRYSPKSMLKEFLKQGDKTRKQLLDIPGNLNAVLDRVNSGKLKFDLDDHEIHRLGIELDRSSNRIAYGMIIGALILAAAYLSTLPIGPQVYGYPLISSLCFILAFVMTYVLWQSIHNERRIERV